MVHWQEEGMLTRDVTRDKIMLNTLEWGRGGVTADKIWWIRGKVAERVIGQKIYLWKLEGNVSEKKGD